MIRNHIKWCSLTKQKYDENNINEFLSVYSSVLYFKTTKINLRYDFYVFNCILGYALGIHERHTFYANVQATDFPPIKTLCNE